MTARAFTFALGGRWFGRYGTARCPAHDDRDPSLTIRDGDDSVLLTCHAGCDRVAIIAALRRAGLWDRAAEMRRLYGANAGSEVIRRAMAARTAPATVLHATLAPWGPRLWSTCRPITPDDPAGRYLRARGCALPHPDGDLRSHPALKHPSGHVGPGLVGLVTGILDVSRWLNLHRTWIAPDGSGRKAFDHLPKDDERPKARLVLKDHTTRDGCIRLWPDCDVETRLVAGEGIESCLAAAREYGPAWSCINAGNLKALPLLAGIETLIIVCDHDPTGIVAVREAGARWHAAGRSVRVLYPTIPGTDWADVARKERCA
jgi:Toprim domain-containing protein